MVIRCKKCGTSLNRYCELRIEDIPEGYRCKSCMTLHSWVDGLPLNYKEVNRNSKISTM